MATSPSNDTGAAMTTTVRVRALLTKARRLDWAGQASAVEHAAAAVALVDSMAREHDVMRLRAEALECRADCGVHYSSFDVAVHSVNDALTAFSAIADEAGEARMRIQTAILLRSNGRFDEGLQEAQAARTAAERLHQPVLEASARCSIASLLIHVWRLDEAVEELRRSEILVASSGDRDQLGMIAFETARLHIRRASKLDPVTALSTASAAPKPSDEAERCALCEIARQVLERALDLFREVGNVRMQASARMQIANVLSGLARYGEAWTILEAETANSRARGDRQTEYWVQIMLGYSLFRAHRYQESIEPLRRALDHAQALGFADISQARNLLSQAHEHSGDTIAALREARINLVHQSIYYASVNERLAQTTNLRLRNQQVEADADASRRYATRLEEANEELRRARGEAESATRAKSAFLANMSHEIRTPMNGILGLSRIVLGAELPPRQRDHVLNIERSARGLLGLLNDILDFSKIEAGKLDMEHVDFDLNEVVRHVTNVVELQAEQKGLALHTTLETNLPQRLLGDPHRLGQVLINLTGNAIKFTERGRIDIMIAALERDDSAVLMRFSVRDTGPGLPPGQRERLFDAFTQADASMTRRHGGTGLGLAISRDLAQLMGGTIGVDSALGVGSTFWFTARLGLTAETAPAQDRLNGRAQEAADNRERLAGSRLLLVEDNDINQVIAVEFLSSPGAHVTVAADGREALDLLARDSFDLVLMDCQMPVLDGYEATRAIRRNPRWAKLPVIAMTANAMAGDREQAFAAGMNDHIAKPLDVDVLYATIARWLPPAVSVSMPGDLG